MLRSAPIIDAAAPLPRLEGASRALAIGGGPAAGLGGGMPTLPASAPDPSFSGLFVNIDAKLPFL